MNLLKNHPFAVETYFENSIVLSYAIAKEELQDMIPECLELDTFDNKWAFVAVAMVNTKSLRPKGFPKLLGNDFFLIGFRVFVRYTDKRGKRLRGLYILKSETNKRKMAFFGNIFTHYNYTTTDISYKKEGELLTIQSEKSALDVAVNSANHDIKLPENSPFKDCKEARRFAGPLPFTFTYNQGKNEVLIIEGVRQNWKPEPLEIQKAEVGFIEDKGFKNIHLANAFVVSNIPYYWKKGKVEQWN
ncbi:hypothetical protein MATR_00180 [Marivirga tractuosa]|uniref:DUF2071 domain-containing protein n=1 Tax=Marivirga tractuosa (strain ATCC 23168 / DSM 4126 / NBRC 15989 / NCIMB 1408 / VKM B-1430 / H-43) TaxID=643867 RepID=E4TLN6_MARTH|nr:DUF2071 domain-containing protein [Marivirga tractuosa]ADR22340.1 hypothetical protein Ftrac_2362 [Marivirga tractuosa DSM 4126]BDD13193.1 hypothetical protein MATR_00180 [Marivirga tractuosa]